MSNKTYKILSLDGGGFRGVISARILKEIEEKLKPRNKKLHEYFDLVTGTSTGSLIAAGIAKGRSADELLNIYQENGQKIFPAHIGKMRSVLKLTRGLFPVALYPHQGLEEVLSQDKILGDTKISEITKPVLLIPAYDTLNRRTVWFCSNNPKSNKYWYDNIELWKICICSASAPTFFPPYQLKTPSKKEVDEDKYLERHLNNLGMEAGKDYPFVDGGIAVNNPALIGIAHALLAPYKKEHPNQEQLKLNDIAVLSIGTGRPKKPYSYQEVKGWGMFGWAQHLGDIFLPAPNDVNANVCWQIIRGGDDENAKRALRLDPKLEEDKELEAIDNPHLYNKFVEIAEDYLSNGKATVGVGITVKPKEAIEKFIQNNPPCE